MNRAESMFESEDRERELREQHMPANDHYTGDSCENCARNRVELLKNGKKICEKCHWDQDTHKYDGFCLTWRT